MDGKRFRSGYETSLSYARHKIALFAISSLHHEGAAFLYATLRVCTHFSCPQPSSQTCTVALHAT